MISITRVNAFEWRYVSKRARLFMLLFCDWKESGTVSVSDGGISETVMASMLRWFE